MGAAAQSLDDEERLRVVRGFGKDGRDGRDGHPGRDGAPGMDGPRGLPGLDGKAGADGEKGDTGEKGEPGERGEQGEKGEPGDKGEPGLNGLDGKDGERGPRGLQGDTGERGPIPDHEWIGTKLRFERPDGSWDKPVDLQGPKGEAGKAGRAGASGVGYGFDNLPAGDSTTPTDVLVKQNGEWKHLGWVQFLSEVGAFSGGGGGASSLELQQTAIDGQNSIMVPVPFSWSRLYINGLRQANASYSFSAQVVTLPTTLQCVAGDILTLEYLPS